jgi:hypothetical protein
VGLLLRLQLPGRLRTLLRVPAETSATTPSRQTELRNIPLRSASRIMYETGLFVMGEKPLT